MLFYIIPHKRSYPASCRRKCRSRPSVHYNDLDLILPAYATSSMLDDMISPLSLSTTNNDKQTYRVSEDDSKYEIVLDVPGVKPADIKVQLEQGGKVLLDCTCLARVRCEVVAANVENIALRRGGGFTMLLKCQVYLLILQEC